MLSKKLLAVLFSLTMSSAVIANEGKNNTWQDEAKDAWIDGKVETTLLFNTNLNSFDINTDVNNGIVTLTGAVMNDVEKDLASELLMGIDGVQEVQNQLTVMDMQQKESDTYAAITDAKIGSVIASRFLFDSAISGMDIDVEVEDRIVTLNGTVASEAERDLAIQIAQNANDVKEVNSKLKIKKGS